MCGNYWKVIVTLIMPVYVPGVCSVPTCSVPPTVSGVSGSNASPATGVVTKLSTLMGAPGPLRVAGEATVTITRDRPEQL